MSLTRPLQTHCPEVTAYAISVTPVSKHHPGQCLLRCLHTMTISALDRPWGKAQLFVVR